MRIAIYIENAGVTGGIEVFARRHKEELSSAGNEVEKFGDFAKLAAADAALPFDRIVVHKCTGARTLEMFPAERTEYYVHDHEPVCPRKCAYTPFGRNCSRASGLFPCLFCAPASRDFAGALKRVFSQRRRKKAMARLAQITVISEFMKRRLEINGVQSGRIKVKPPEIHVARSVSSVEGESSLDIDLLYVGQLIRGKGVHLLLRAMALMKAKRRLDIVGTGNMEPRLKALARRLEISDRVTFRGFKPDPSPYMAAARCVVVPSLWQEPYGLVAAEASALGRQVVAFAVGGLPEAAGLKAVLVPPGDVKSLASTLDNLARFCPFC